MDSDIKRGRGMGMEKDGGGFKELDELVERLGQEAGEPDARSQPGMRSIMTRTASETIVRSGGKVVSIVRAASTTETVVPAEDETEDVRDGDGERGEPERPVAGAAKRSAGSKPKPRTRRAGNQAAEPMPKLIAPWRAAHEELLDLFGFEDKDGANPMDRGRARPPEPKGLDEGGEGNRE